MAFSDSHCHLVRNGTQPEHIAEAPEQARIKGVETIVSMVVTMEPSASNIRLTQSYQGVLAAIGIHPWYAMQPTGTPRRDLRQLTGMQGVVAIDEIGVDYPPDNLIQGYWL